MRESIHDEIAERLEAATGPDPILDVLIKIAFRPHPQGPRYEDVHEIESHPDFIRFILKQTNSDGKHYYGDWGLNRIEPVTASVDTMLLLVKEALPEWEWTLASHLAGAVAFMWLDRGGSSIASDAYAPTPALALLKSFMGAWRQSKAETVSEVA
mgnify:CR=1 FL=1